ILQRGGEIGGYHGDVPVRWQLAADQQVVQVGVGLKVIHGVEHIGQMHAWMISIASRGKDVPRQYDARIQRWTPTGNPQAVTIPQWCSLPPRSRQIHV